MKIVDVQQGTEEWFEVRAGIPTSSEFKKLITTKGIPSKSAKKYLYQLVGELLCGRQEDGYTSYSMERGKEMESEARQFYELTEGVEVQEVGFCLSDDMQYGCSPDGLVEDDGGLEIKCPAMATHVGYLLKNSQLLKDYFQQVQGSLFVTGRKWWDLISYYPALRPVIIRVKPDKEYHKKLSNILQEFCGELTSLYEELKCEPKKTTKELK